MVLSLATQELVRDHLPPGVSLRDLGEHRLKDLIRPEHVFQVVAPDLLRDFPPLRSLDSLPNNLPLQRVPLIGRERELRAVKALLLQPDIGLVTLIGTGGTGKTRLALQVAADVLDAFKDGAWFINLAPISDPALVVSTIAQTLGAREVGQQPLIDNLTYAVKDREQLLVLDNFEQVLTAAPAVATLLAAATSLKVLVTSRAPLHLYGEYEFPVPPLELPDLLCLPPLERLSQYEAVRLFIQRAQAVKPNFAITNANAPAVAEICTRLDGLPLAIELAAARSKLFAPQALLARLGNRLQVLAGGARDLPGRQQTIRNTIDWSYELLAVPEQRLFTRLAIFVGGWTLEAAEAVCDAAEGDLGMDVLDGLTALVEQSLLQRGEGRDGEPRFRRLETIGEYAVEQLEASDEAEALRARHAAYYLSLAEIAEPALRGPAQLAWLDRLELDYDNLRAALTWSLALPGRTEVALRLIGALSLFWCLRNHVRELEQWLAATLERDTEVLAAGDTPPQHAAYRAKALFWAAYPAVQESDLPRALELSAESLALFQAANDPWGISAALAVLGHSEHATGTDPVQGQARLRESVDRAQTVGEPWLIAFTAGCAFEDAALLDRRLTLARESGAPNLIGMQLCCRGHYALDAYDAEQAATCFAEALAYVRAIPDATHIANVLWGLGEVARMRGTIRRHASITKNASRSSRSLVNSAASLPRGWCWA